MIRLATAIRTAVKTGLPKKIITHAKVFTRLSSITTWNKDWQPGPYPKTEEERIAAAKKYNMLPEDYEPYPEEEGYGDYPKFPAIHNDMKDEFQVYDYSFMKRNYGEPIHPDLDICLGDRVNFQQEYPLPFWKMALLFVSGATLYTLLILYSESHPIDHRTVPKQYPHRGEVSYTFEPAE